jgi:hypothetical protein
MLDPERPPVVPDLETVPDPRAVSGSGTAGAGLRRLLAVLGICAAVVLATVVTVQRSVDRMPAAEVTGAGVTADGGAAQSLRAGGQVPPLDPATAARPTGAAVGDGANQVPARPAAALADLLRVRAAALMDGDRAMWLAGLAPASDARVNRFRAAQAQVFDRVRSLRPVSWSYQVFGGSPLPAQRRAALGTVAWVADVQLDYQLTAGGPKVQRQQSLTVVRRAGGGWLIADDTDGSTGRDVWDLGPIAHAVSSRCLVVGAEARRAQVERFAAECESAAATVDAAWGRSWPRRTVLTVPNTVPQLAVLLGRSDPSRPADPGGSAGPRGSDDTAGLDKTAAVTIGPSDGAADTVLINGEAFDQLSVLGRRVVLTHELVHVATRATGSWSAPTWLSEGYADYVAYADTGLSAQEVAGEALDAVRAGRLPDALPATDDFNAAGDEAAAGYGFAWAAVELIAAKAGDANRMKAFYRQAAAPGAGAAGLDAALTGVGLGDTAGFVKVWQAHLRKLAA